MSTYAFPRPSERLDARFVVAVWQDGVTRYARRVSFPSGKLYGVGTLGEAEIVTGARVPVVIMALAAEHPLNRIEVRAV